ncbi:hypothetical protein [Paenibacillus sp. FSL L8-0708]|uniref:hypothetical protein n=1 Tax=Paenibacillus sp. FSL L8-0708 TaxID=2975311 RepID=UPI0030FA417A
MEIRYKLYPYPVMSYYSDDYVNSSFDTTIDPKKDGLNIRIDFLTNLNNVELTKYLTQGKVKFVYHLECAQTGFRTALQTSNSEFTYIISNKKICGRLQICPFIVAIHDIPDYVNSSFHEDYRGFKFLIEAGCVMAVGKQVNIDIEKNINDLSNTPSVFSIIKNADETALGMIVDLDQKKIVIKLPERDYYNYKSIKDEAVIQPVLNSLVVVPALTYVLEELNRRDPSERYEYSSYSWYRAIKKALSNQFQCDVESDQLSKFNMLEVAQKMINIPISDALQALSSGYKSEDEEDTE